jgi:hypothetical protein
VSPERIDVTPEPTPAEAEAIRRALEALGLLEASPEDRGGSPNGPGDDSVTGSMQVGTGSAVSSQEVPEAPPS